MSIDERENDLGVYRVASMKRSRFLITEKKSVAEELATLVNAVSILDQWTVIKRILTILEVGTDDWHPLTVQKPLAMPRASVQCHERDNQIGSPRPLDAAYRHVDRAALRQHLFQAVLADVAVPNGVGSDKGGETTGAQQVIDPADKIGHQIGKPSRRVLPLHIVTE